MDIERDRDHAVKFMLTKAGGESFLNLLLEKGPVENEALIARTKIKSKEVK